MKTLRPAAPAGPGAESWLLPFAVVNLLLAAVFLVLNSSAQNDIRKLRENARASEGPQGNPMGQIGLARPSAGSEGARSSTASGENSTIYQERLPPNLRRISTSLSRALKMLDAQQVCLGTDKRGMVLNISAAILFEPGSAMLRQQAKPMLDALGIGLGNLPNSIIIEGHADEEAFSVGEKFSSNWKLGTDRTLAIVQHLVENEFVSPDRLAIGAFGVRQPIYVPGLPLESSSNFNSRIDLIILDAPLPTLPRAPVGEVEVPGNPQPGF